MAINNPLSPRLIYNHINGTSHASGAQIGSGITMSSLRTASVTFNNVKAAPDTMSEWDGYTHEQSMGSLTYVVRIATAQSNWGLNQISNDDAVDGSDGEADGGIVLWRTHDSSNTYIRAKRLVLGSLQGTRTDSGNKYPYTGSTTSALTTSTDGQVIITIPVSDVTIQAAQHNFSGGSLSTPVSKTSGTIGAPGSETDAVVLVSLGATTADAQSGIYGSGDDSDEHQSIFKITLTASKTGYTTTVINGIVLDCHNSATAEEEEEEEECGQCCIHEDMLIATGEDMKSIHDIEIGDSVVSYNFETGENELVEVEDKIVVERDVDYKINDLILTEDHPIYLDTGRKASIDPQSTLRNYKQEVDEVKVGDVMQKLDGSTEEITSIERYEGTHVNYTLKTKHNNFYANDILVSWVDSR